MSKPIGSVTFGTANVRTDEYLLLARTIVENGSSLEQAVLDIAAIDDLLGIQKINLIINGQRHTKTGRLRKNSSMLDIISGRIDQLIEDSRDVK